MSKNNETPLDFAMAGIRSFYKKGNSYDYDYNYDHGPDEYYVDDFDDYYYHGCGIRRFNITVDSYDHYGDYYEGNSISKLQIVIEKNRMGIMTYKRHLFFKIISIQI
jgi:hypothetical protein